MINKGNFKQVLLKLGFTLTNDSYTKKFSEFNTELKVDFEKQELIYPEKDGFTVNERQTCNFKQAENFVVFECVDRLLSQKYNPKHIELEPKWQVGHGASGGRADILIKDNDENALLIIECKTAGAEFTKAWNTTQVKPTQLFSYVQQTRSTKFIALYASDFVDEKVKADYYLINVSDNKKLLESDKSLKSYADANTVDEIYAVWVDTYKKDYATIGLFEDTRAYEIGKEKYSVDDLKQVSSRDIQGKYHEFATIMRQHNVSGRENAFDKLVNLFLCKVVDEANNPQELKFFWKGVAYDDPFSMQDRLNHLYKIGMKKFLGEDITYIENSQIDSAFSVFADKPNMTKEIIEGFFKELKFFTNNDFSFIDVHNEPLFHQNFEVLLKILKMLQDIKLTGADEEHQFLGDMFEGFLDNGIKQSEGQFFTPMPIVKFIANSLPLESIQKKQDNPKAIDYACGAGHFLNEVANHFPKEYHKNIYGIEKEYRLSKVAKVSSFMYGQDDINIIYADALSSQSKVQNDSFSVLVANPPYSVKGFLETLDEGDRDAFELLKSIEAKSYTANNSIECFFIERAKQLLQKDGVAGIILPSSILSKGTQNIATNKSNIYVKTREILFKYFDIIAIAEFGSGTFGKTGTNTVTLFLQRRPNNPDMQKHLEYMLKSWFSGDFTTNEMFKDKDLLQEYVKHIEVDLADYKSLLEGKPNENLLKNEMFVEYAEEFLKLTETKNRKKQKTYKALSADKRQEIEHNELVKYMQLIEEDKFYYFSLAFLNKKEVLIVKAPSDGAKNKKFLGYEWSGRKGDEGIKYITSSATKAEKQEDSESETLENILNLSSIQTPLYNPNDREDESKINSLISKNFSDEVVEIPEHLSEFVNKARLVDMLDFSRGEFGKYINTSPKRNITLNSRWKFVKLMNECDVRDGTHESPKFYEQGYPLITSKNLVEGRIDFSDIKYISKEDYLSFNKRSKVEEGDVLFAMIGTVGNPVIVKTDVEIAIKNVALFKEIQGTKLLNSYLTLLLDYEIVKVQLESEQRGSNRKFVSLTILRNLQIPLPPLNIQEKIVKECEVVDRDVQKAESEIEKSKESIETLFKETLSKATQSFKLSDANSFSVSIGKRILKNEFTQNEDDIPVYSANVFDPFGTINKDLLKDFSIPSVLWGIDGDWMVNYLEKEQPFYPTDHCGVLRVKTDEVHPRYLTWVLKQEGEKVRFSRTHRASIDRIKGITVNAPSKKEQETLVKEVQKLEEKIATAQKTLESSSEKKQAILKKYL